MSSKFRVRFSGLILFLSNLISFLLGFIFIVLISRNLSQNDLGLWFYIGSIINYFEFLVKVLPYWATRDFARGRLIARTSIISSLIISIPLTIVFLSISGILSTIFRTVIYPFLVASMLIPIYYTSSSINSIIYVKYPHRVGWRVPIIDGLKIPLAFCLLSYGLTGVLSAVVIANIIYILYGLYLIRGDLEKRLDIDWLKNRFKHSWLPFMQSAIGYVNSASDQFLVGTFLSPEQLSTYGIGITISNAVKTSSQLALPFRMNVLAKSVTSKEEVGSIIKFVTIFIIPMFIGGMIISQELFGIFGVRYRQYSWVSWPLLASAVLTSYSAIFSGILSGLERKDINLGVDFKTLLKSKLFKLTLIDYCTTIILVVSSVILIPTLGVFGAALSRLVTASILFTILFMMCMQYLRPIDILKNVSLVTLACIPMIIYLVLFKPVGAISTLLTIIVAANIYFVSLYVIDKRSRRLIKTLIQEASQRLFHPSE